MVNWVDTHQHKHQQLGGHLVEKNLHLGIYCPQ